MKKWLFILSILLLILLAVVIYIFGSAQTDKHQYVEELLPIVQEETETNIIQVERFHGEQLYHVFLTEDVENQQLRYAFVNEDIHINHIVEEEIALSAEEAGGEALSAYAEVQRVIRVNPGYTDGKYVWEVVAEDEENRLQYIYFLMTDGSFHKRYIVS